MVALMRTGGQPGMRAAIAAMVCTVCGSSAMAAEPLPVGIVTEHTPLTILLRLAAAGWGVFLLVSGVRKPWAAAMSFYLPVGVGIGLAVGGRVGYAVSLAIAVAVVIAAAALIVWLPRIATALACLWPLPAVYAVHLYFSGSFERSAPLAITLAVAGAVTGAVWPRGGTTLLAAALGTVLVISSMPWQPSSWAIYLIAAGSLMWQLLALERMARSPFADIPSWPETERRRPRQFAAAVRVATAVLAVLVVTITLFAPQYGPSSEGEGTRAATLVENGSLTRPSLVLSRGDNLYLAGRATPIAIVAPDPGLLSRLALPLVGRSAAPAIHRLRAVKDEGELDAMRRAAAVTSQAFVDIAPLITPGTNESAIAEAIVDSYRRSGATGIAFDSIVGSGANATLPHYMKNNTTMTAGMVVIDIGCSIDGYASDMTRTFPVTGTYAAEQLELMDTVNAAGDAARAILRAGVTMSELDAAARQVIDDAGFGPYFLHGLGHHVGLDVHDPHAGPLESGMVITIEPGIYISRGSDIDPSYWDLGVRIEDSYIVTDDGYEEITGFPRIPFSESDTEHPAAEQSAAILPQ